MITAERHPSAVPEPPRTRSEFDRVLRPATERDTRPPAAASTTVANPVVASLDLEHTGGETGLLVAFVVTTMAMVVGVTALAVLSSSWLLVPVVLVHWIATSVILARINALLSQ